MLSGTRLEKREESSYIWRHGERVWRVPTGGERSKGTVAGGAAALGRTEEHHLGFKQFAGRGLRYVAEWDGRWVALVGWQGGAFKAVRGGGGLAAVSALNRSGPGGAQEPGSQLGRNPARTRPGGTGWSWPRPSWRRRRCTWPRRVGRTRGYGRSNGSWTERHGERKEMLLYPSGGCARAVAGSGGPAGVGLPGGGSGLREGGVPVAVVAEAVGRGSSGGRRGASTGWRRWCDLVLARLAGKVGPTETARFAKSLTQEELRVLGTWFDPKANCFPPSLATIHRVLAHTGPDSLARPPAPRCREGTAFAGDGKRRGEPSRAGEAALGDGDAGGTRFGASGSEPQFRRGGRGGCRGAGAAGGGRPARAHGHPRRPAHLPRHRAGPGRSMEPTTC